MRQDSILAIAATALVFVLLALVLRRRRRARVVASIPRKTQFGSSAVDPAVADNFRAAWERCALPVTEPPAGAAPEHPAAPRGSRTSIGYAVLPLRTSGLADAEHEPTTFDADLPSKIEHYHGESRRLARGSRPPLDTVRQLARDPAPAPRSCRLATDDRPTAILKISRPPIDR